MGRKREDRKERRRQKKDFETSGVELEALEIGVRVAFLDELDDVVTRSSERDVVGHSPWHAGMQDSDELAFGVEDCGARVAFAGKVAVFLAEVKYRDLPRIVLELVTCISLQLREATKGKVGRLPILGNDEASIAILVQKVGIGQACGVDTARQPE